MSIASTKNVNIFCEFSDTVRMAFENEGYPSTSYDFEPSLHGSENHRQQDCLTADQANLTISFPPCTYLCVSGARWWNERLKEQSDAIDFFLALTKLPGRWAIENPIGIMSRVYRKPDQIIQPWMFGHGEIKATCLWLNGLPKLKPTDIVDGRIPRVHHESPGIVRGLTRQQRRAITYPGIAQAMAKQWGRYAL